MPIFTLMFVGCLGAKEVTCPDIAIQPHSTVLFDPGLVGPGEYEVTVTVDGTPEACALHLGEPRPAVHVDGMVGMGVQDALLSCTSASIAGFRDDGGVAGIAVPGTPKTWSLKVVGAGKTVVETTFTPDYTPDECGFVKPSKSVAVVR